MIDAVIFDMDGVIIDSEPLWQDVEVEVFRDLGVSLTPDLCQQTMGFRVDEAVAHWRARYPWDGPDDAAVVERIVDGVMQAVAERGVAKPGLDHAVAFFAARVDRLAICSSSYYRVISVVLDRCGLGGRFAVVHSAEDEERGKPDPAVYLSTAGKLGVCPDQCLAVEDSPYGVLSAQAAGMRCLAVPEPGTADDARIRRADLVLPSLEAIDDRAWRDLNAE